MGSIKTDKVYVNIKVFYLNYRETFSLDQPASYQVGNKVLFCHRNKSHRRVLKLPCVWPQAN